jgi:tRNA pseudouridine55 synthase
LSINGILNINKPAGKTSIWVVSLVRHYSGERHVGHVGTLDPLAVGVLPVCLGQAARMSTFILSQHKTYLAEIELGISTDTDDLEGRITQVSDPSNITLEQLEKLLPDFTGSILQKPPMYSALKHEGKRLYHIARAGIEVERAERQVEVSRIELLQWQPPRFTIEVECGKGTYIRSLAHDIGHRLGSGAYLKGLIRTSCGLFNIKDSITIPHLEDAFKNNYWQDMLYPMDMVLENFTAVIVNREQEHAIRNGRPLSLNSASSEKHCRAYSLDGRFLALLRSLPTDGVWQPEKVFPD